VRTARERIGMTQTELAGRLGLSRTSITNIERGRQVVLVHQLLALSVALEISAADLLPDPSEDRREPLQNDDFADLSALVRGLTNYESDPIP
jgi:transcriptional regulator with XRE-family HTH domain